MRFFEKADDGGKGSGVTAYFLFEIKWLGSIALLKFNKGSREAFHSHAFNAVTWWLKGEVLEIIHHGPRVTSAKFWSPSVFPKITKRDCFHKIEAKETTWALTVRGPWLDHWREFKSGKYTTLTHGRKEI